MFVQRGMSQRVLFLQGLVISRVRMFVARLVVGPFDLSESEFESGSPTALTLVSMVEADNADEDGAFSEVRSETTPPGVPLTGLVRRAGNLQYPMPDCQRSGPQTCE
jgi:hypothetical protein